MSLNFPGIIKGPETLVAAAAPQALTANWVDLGNEQYVAGARRAGLWLTLDINDSTDARVRCLAKHENAGAEEYTLSIRTVGASDVKLEPEYFEFNVDEDRLMLLSVELDGLVPYVQFQVQAGVVGATAGQIDAAYLTTAF